MKPAQLRPYASWISVLSFIAGIVSLYLVFLHYVPEGSTLCVLGDKFNCDVVNKSTYAELFGIPVALLGFLFYVFLWLGSSFLYFRPEAFAKIDLKDLVRAVMLITFIGIAFTLYLTYMEAFTLKTFCIFCLIQQAIILVVGGILTKIYFGGIRGDS